MQDISIVIMINIIVIIKEMQDIFILIFSIFAFPSMPISFALTNEHMKLCY